jgi:hypothetical protein
MRASFVICDICLDDRGEGLFAICGLKVINFGFGYVVQVLMKSKIASRRIHRKYKSEIFDISGLFGKIEKV